MPFSGTPQAHEIQFQKWGTANKFKKLTKRKNITVLHCHTDYPTQLSDVNLLAMKNMENKGLSMDMINKLKGLN